MEEAARSMGAMARYADSIQEGRYEVKAFTDVDRCESEPEKAYRVNGLGTRNVAMACDARCSC